MARAATNWVANPSFETNTTGWTISGATSARVNDAAFSGNYALEVTDTTPTGAIVQTNVWIPITEGQGVYVAARLMARQINAEATIEVLFRDALDLNIYDPLRPVPIWPLTTDPLQWTTISDYLEAPTGAVKVGLVINLSTVTGAAVGDKWLLDAMEIRIEEPLDGYFDGDSPNAHWTGTAHASASIRDEVPFQFAQAHDSDDIEVSYRLWTVDDNLNDDVELTDWFDNGSIKSNIEDDIKRTATFEFKNLNVLDPFVTRLKVYMEIYNEGALTGTYPLGVFSIDMPDGTITYENRYGRVDANDISIELADSARGKQFTFAKNAKIVDEAEKRIRLGRGYKANFPSDTKKFSKKEKFPPWMGDLELVNTLLEMANMRGCYGDENGIIVTRKIKKLSQMQPVLKIGQHQVMSLEETNDTEQLCNVVKVYKDNPDKTPIFAIVRNDDPADPVSTVNMRYKALVISDSEVEDSGDAYELAAAKLEEGKSFDKTLALEISPAPTIGIGNVIDLTFDMADGTCYCGRYWVRSWELPLGPPFWMKVNINRVQKFHDGFPEDDN